MADREREPRPSTQTLKALGMATGGVAHDVRSALSTIVTRAALIQADPEAPANAEHARAILRAARQAGRVIERVRRLLKPPSDAPRVRVDLAALARAVADEARHKAAGVELVVEAEEAEASGDPSELGQALANLVANAVEAGAARVTLAVGAEAPGRVRVDVADDGPGLDPEVAANLFTPFVTTKGDAGTGLGLVLCRQIAEAHGGELRVESAAGRGVRASLVLPAAVESTPRPRVPTALSLGVVDQGERVLVVDDDEDGREALAALLSASGMEVREAPGVEAALAVFDQFGPHLLVTDLRLGAGDGLQLAQRLRARDAILPVLLLTGEVDALDAARRAGIDVALAKPVNPGTLVEAVRRLAGARAQLEAALAGGEDG